MSRNVDRQTNRRNISVRYEEELPKDFDQGRRNLVKVLAFGLGATAVGGSAGLAWLMGGDQTDGLTEEVIKVPVPEEPQLRARAAEQVNPEISLKARVEEKIASARIEKSLMAIRAKTSIPNEAIAGLRARETGDFDYVAVVQTVVTAAYREDFYESDGRTINSEISRSIDELKKQSDPTVKEDIQRLAFYYLTQVERVVSEQGDLSLALRFADLAGRLEPELIPYVIEAIDRAVKANGELNVRRNSLVLEPTNQIKIGEVKERGEAIEGSIEIDLRRIFGPEFVPSSEPQNAHTKVIIDSGIMTESDNRERTRTLGPGLVWTPEVLAAYLHRRVSLGLSLREGGVDQTWTAIETRPLKEVMGDGVFREVIEVVTGGLGAVNPVLPSVVEGVIKNSADNLVVATFQQQTCLLDSTPCTARAIVLRGLVEEGLNYRILTLAEMFLDSVNMTISEG